MGRAAARTASTYDDRLVEGMRGPLAAFVFLAGAWAAVHRLPLPGRWMFRADGVLFVATVTVLAFALIRAWRLALGWYTAASGREGGDRLAAEFGPLFRRLGQVFIALVAVITILQHFGVNVASLVVSLGVGSLAVGLAAQDTLANMFAGFTLMLDRPFRVGDRIRLATGEIGDVESIGMRATVIKTLDETHLVVPNALLVKERLVNQSLPTPAITTRLEVGVAYGTDLARARAILREAVLAAPYVATEREPMVLVTRFGDFAVTVLVTFWAKDYREQGLALSAVHEEVYRRFAEAGIEIPFPVRRVLQETPPGRAPVASTGEGA